MPTISRDLRVEQGSDFRDVFPVETSDGVARNLIGWRAVGVVKQHAAGEVLYTLPLTVSAGRVALTIPGADSSAWTWRLARYEINLFGPDGASQERLAAGGLSVDQQLWDRQR